MLTWKIDVHVLDLAVQGGDSGSSRAVQVEEAHQGEESDLMSVITKLDQEYSDLYNSRQFKDIGKLYEEGAVFLPNEIGNGFIVGTDDIADYLATIYYVKDGKSEEHFGWLNGVCVCVCVEYGDTNQPTNQLLSFFLSSRIARDSSQAGAFDHRPWFRRRCP